MEKFKGFFIRRQIRICQKSAYKKILPKAQHYWSIFCQASLKNFPVVILCIGIVFGFQNLIHLNLDGGWLGAELGSH